MAFGIILSSSAAAYSYSQLSNITTLGVKITSPFTGQQVPVGELTISGISTDNVTTDCTVYADINNTKPFQKAVATGPSGVNDYSTWTFTYTPEYHLITNGTNNLTSKLSCIDDDGNSVNLTKYHSVNLTGVAAPMVSTAISNKNLQHRQQLASFNIDNASSLYNEAAVEGITTTSNISKPSAPLPIVAENLNLSAANSINLTGATTSQIASEEQQQPLAVTAVTTTTPITTSASSVEQPCCTSNGYIANAGSDQTMLEGTRITLNGSGTSNNSSNIGTTPNYLWRQMDGPAIILKGNNTAHPNFVAPNYPNDTKYTFALEVFDNNQVNNNNQKGSAIDLVDILVMDANAKSKKGGSFQEQLFASNYKSQSQTESFGAATTNGEDEEEEKNGDKLDTSSAATTTNQYDQVEEIEKVKEKEKPDTESVTEEEEEVKKGSDSKEEDEQEKEKSHDESEQKTEESELQIEKLKEKEKTQEDYDDDGSNSNIIDNHNTIFSSNNNNNNNNNNDHKENDVFIFNYDIKLKKFTDKMKQNIEKLKDRLENSFNER